MPAFPVPERELFWRNFDIQYHGAHPGLRHMNGSMWELPHWMHWLAGVLIDDGFASLDVLDLYSSAVPGTTLDEHVVRDAIRRHEANVYLFSPMTANINFAYEIANLIKDAYPKCAIVFGGVMATPLCLEVASHSSVDYVVFDRGESALPALLRALDSRKDICDVGNLAYKDSSGQAKTNHRRYPYVPVNDIPFPKIDLFPPSTGEALRYIRIVHALGCPYKCPFCTIQTIGRKADYFAVDRALSEIRAYRNYYGEHHNIYWGDETFTLDANRTLALCGALETEGDISYDCQTRLNCLANPKMINQLARSDCRWLEVGIETMNQSTQDIFKQRVNIATAEETLRRVRDAGIATCSFMVNGFPNQTLDEMNRSIDTTCELIDRDLLQASYLQVLVPYPGGDLFEHPERYGMRLNHKSYELYSEDMYPVFDSAYASAEESYEVFKAGLTKLAQAMHKKPYFGSAPPAEQLHLYGRFWADSHA